MPGGPYVGNTQAQPGTLDLSNLNVVLPAGSYSLHKFPVWSYGAVGDGVTDDTTHIQAAIAAAAANGGGDVLFDAKTYLITAMLTIQNHHVNLIGVGSDVNHASSGVGAPAGATIITWGGAANGTMLQMRPPNGATKQLTGNKIQSIAFLSNNGSAGIGLEIMSVNSGYFFDLYFDNFNAHGIWAHVVPNGQLTSDARNTNFCIFKQIQCTNLANSGHCITLDGDIVNSPFPDCSQNTFIAINTTSQNGNALNLNYADSNYFYACGFGARGTGLGIRMGGNSTGPSFDNMFVTLFAGAYTSITVETGSKWNVILGITYAESPPTPTIQAGAALSVMGMGQLGWFMQNMLGIKVIIADSQLSATNAVAALTTESLRLKNSSFNHLILDDGTHTSAIAMDASGNIILNASTAGAAVTIGGSGYPTINSGSGAPSGTQPKGSIYMRTNGAVGSTLYVSQGGGTWNAVAGV